MAKRGSRQAYHQLLLWGRTDEASPPHVLAAVRGRIVWPLAMSSPSPGFGLSDGWDLSGLTLAKLWLRYLALGGNASPALLEAYARGLVCPDRYEHNMIAQAINEHFMDRGEDHPVGYQEIPFPC
jgi:hypothetical protein